MTSSQSVVLDASAAGAVVFREPEALRVLPHLLAADAIVVPQLFFLELANIGRTKVRKGQIGVDDARTMLSETDSWPVQVLTVPWSDAWAAALRTHLTVYDASYLSIALRENRPILTLDHALIAAAGDRSLL